MILRLPNHSTACSVSDASWIEAGGDDRNGKNGRFVSMLRLYRSRFESFVGRNARIHEDGARFRGTVPYHVGSPFVRENMNRSPRYFTSAFRIWIFVGLSCALASTSHAAKGEFEIRVLDNDTDKPIAVRMHLMDQRGRARRAGGTVNWGDHFVFFHKIVLKLPPGTYSFEMERGPEYHVRSGHFVIESGATDNTTVRMQRFVHMKKQGWWSGDLHVARRPRDIKLLMLAEDLHVAPVVTWGSDVATGSTTDALRREPVVFDDDRYFRLLAGRDWRQGGSLLFFNLDQPLPLDLVHGEFSPRVDLLKRAQQTDASHTNIEQPFGWETPLWVASGMVHSIGLASGYLGRDKPLSSPEWGKRPDASRYPDPHGTGQWMQDIYYHLLNCGLRLPPTAASSSGWVSNPVGYNRVYVYIDGDVSYDGWWSALEAGRVIVTNGPLLRPSVHGQAPGHVFCSETGNAIRLTIDLQLAIRDAVDYLEIVKDGEVAHAVKLDEWAAAHGHLPDLEFEESGWFLVRAVASHGNAYRFASTGPYYVEVGGKTRISKTSAQFFLDWVFERARSIRVAAPDQYHEILKFHRAARDYWQRLVDTANAK